ncbi:MULTISPECIES: eCIS core domain-containing protein [Pseudanabaena]|jgi:hypothetical protein|uniref:eCIS core domain-containing protein n=1 Tax=Pseudanabaena TaxID=1152 RepID=UPI00247918FD|nr:MULTISPECIES: DUF4157 domain-containing protein [Pseudanabaena]MEA5490314.1 DUF4157 domain-containing protein [Pseudanabaena sp. CCNP1317]WGS74759.1 DUF4157 domain-containing protein [Pseudanabaena galeata CCNP1313]
MKSNHENSPKITSSVAPTTLNLQTRPFAPIEAVSTESPSTEKTEKSEHQQKYSPNILERLINSPPPEPASSLQRKPENRLKAIAQNRLIQAKLAIGEPNDKYEKEADDTASKVVQQINTPIQNQSIQRDALPQGNKLRKKPLQRRENVGGGDASTELETSIQSARGGGQPLAANLQRSMGQAMGADFSGVKVHTDSQSDQLNQSIQAKAFTTGQDVFFRQGAYEPSSRGGQELIAHELTHVVQQNGGAVQRSPEIQRDGEETPVATKTPKEAALETINRNKKYKERFEQELRKMVKRKIPEGEMALIWQRFSSAMKRHEVLLPRWNEINWGKDSERAKAVDVTEIQLAKLEAFRQDIEFLTELVETDQGEELQVNNVTLWSNINIGRPAANSRELNEQMSVAGGGTPLNRTSMGALLDLFAVGALEGGNADLKNVNGDLLLNDNNSYMQWGGSFNVWAAVSANFAAKATGEVHVYVPTGTGTGSVFWTAELPELRKNPSVTGIFIHELSGVGKASVAQEKAKTINQMELQTILKSPEAWTTSTISGLTVTGAGGGQGISAGKLKNMGNKWKSNATK